LKDSIVEGIGPFEVEDEPYLMEVADDIEVLLDSRYTGTSESYVAQDWHEDRPRPLMWRRRQGKGEVLYFALGHRCGRYDLQDLTPELPVVMDGPWGTAAFDTLISRCVAWGVGAGSAG
jgi:type 1 glutamine amidotransferase